MSGIRGKNTRPEIIVRQALHKAGLRFRLHRKDLPGKPDLVLPKYHAVIFVHGCFWHGHGCSLFKWPSTRKEFWHEKINKNIARDRRDIATLLDAGWRVLCIWECALKGRDKLEPDGVVLEVKGWLNSSDIMGVLAGGNSKD